jgi:hypothetical protein
LDKLTHDPRYVDLKVLPVLESLHEDMQAITRLYSLREYDLGFDYTAMLEDSDIDARAHQVDHLVENDTFIYGQLLVGREFVHFE